MGDEKSDIEILREKNIQERDAFLASFMKDPGFTKAVKAINLLNHEKPKNTKTYISKKRDESFRFFGRIPAERRSSARLQNKKPDYSYEDLKDTTHQIKMSDDESYSDLEDIVYEVKKPRKSSSRNPPAKILPVEEVTEEMISKIVRRGNKKYSDVGSSCHQCRQKTLDTKTVCRSGVCIGVRGQFCGICVINRYGEDPAEALKDPNWKCYVCRGICNCSFCRIKQGKRPTGILTPIALKNGFKSVQEFLVSLNGYGDYVTPEKDPKNLLGFENLNVAVMGGDLKIQLEWRCCDNKNNC